MTWPKEDAQNAWYFLYNGLMFLGTIVPAYFVAPWLPFVVALAWVAFWQTDLYILPSLFPEPEAPREVLIEKQAEEWVRGNWEKLTARVAELESQVGKKKRWWRK